MAQIDTLTADNFDELVLQSSKPYLVDFWATWCRPCRSLTPIIEDIAQEHEGSLRVGKLDIESHQELATRYHVLSIPTLILFKNGKPLASMVGAAPKGTILKKLLPLLEQAHDEGETLA